MTKPENALTHALLRKHGWTLPPVGEKGRRLVLLEQ